MPKPDDCSTLENAAAYSYQYLEIRGKILH